MGKAHRCKTNNPWRNFRIKKDPIGPGVADFDAIMAEGVRARNGNIFSRAVNPNGYRVSRVIDMRCGL